MERKSKIFFALIPIFICLIYVLPALAAFPYQLPQTGQNTCYDNTGNLIKCACTGQDGDYLAGALWPNPRFKDNLDDTINDNLTGLVWSKDANIMMTRDPDFDNDFFLGDGMVFFETGLNYIKKLNAENYLGYNDWRLPNILELESLSNPEESNVALWLNSSGFVNVQEGYYLSSTNDIFTKYDSWVFGMVEGNTSWGGGKIYNYSFLWPVRGTALRIPQTGQINCYDSNGSEIICGGTGQDGDIKAGIKWPEPRFTDNGKGLITDNFTGLAWPKNANTPGTAACGSGTDKTWQEAIDYIKCINSYTYLGFNDWRLPNRKELISLLNYGIASNIAPWLNSTGFENVQSWYYWTSTNHLFSPGDTAWVVSLADGYINGGDKNNIKFPVLPVRVGEANNPACRPAALYVSAAIKAPHTGKKITGNIVTIVAEIITGYKSIVKNIRFQYKPASSSTWIDVQSTNPAAFPNPDATSPYFIHWNVKGLLNGEYNLRAVATSNSLNIDPNPQYITVTIQHSRSRVKNPAAETAGRL